MKRNNCTNISKIIVSQNLKPVIFWDTCSLLDIIRIHHRTTTIDGLKNYKTVREKIINNEVFSVASIMTHEELKRNFQIVDDEYKTKDRKMQSQIELQVQFLKESEIVTPENAGNGIFSDELYDYLKKIYDDIISKTYFIIEQNKFNRIAHFRVIHHIPPARKKGEYKDCYIWLSCLELCNKVVNQVYFFTTNIKDYLDDKNNPQTELFYSSTFSNVEIISNVGELKSKI